METRANTFNVIFHLRKDRLQDEKLPIYARITIMGTTRLIAPRNDMLGLRRQNR